MIDNNLLTIFLNFHETLASLKKLRNEGKQISNRICDLMIESEILQKSPNRGSLSQGYQSLYTYALNQLKKRVGGQMVQFEESYLQKLITARSSMQKSQQILQKIKMDLAWIGGSNSDFKNSLYELKQILKRISKGQKEQIEMIIKKWGLIRNSLLRGENVCEQMKVLSLHISFQTHVEDSLLKNWDEGITGLQSKRYK